MIKKDNGRIIPKKNYVYLLIIVVLSLMVVFYFSMWYKAYRTSIYSVSVLDDDLSIIRFNEIDDYVIENKDILVYVSVLGNEDINKFEVKFKNTIKDNNLRDKILYMDVTEYDDEVVFEKFGIDKNYPYIVVYTNGKITDTYSINENGYSTKKVIKYLNRIGVIEND